jgi:hypothetical protein
MMINTYQRATTDGAAVRGTARAVMLKVSETVPSTEFAEQGEAALPTNQVDL